MNGYLSLIKYFPDNSRDDGFGIGLILISEEANLCLKRISNDRLKRINSSFGIKKSLLLGMTIEEILSKSFTYQKLNYLSVYENGNIRYTKPQVVDSKDLYKKFDDLYYKLVADYYEKGIDDTAVLKKEVSNRLGYSFRKQLLSSHIIKEKLNIGYDFKYNAIGKFVFGNSSIDFIGGNGTVYAGEIIDLDLQEDSLQRSFNKTIALFEAIEITYSDNDRFDPKECKLLVLEDQALNPERSKYMDILNTWHTKAKYDLVIKKDMIAFQSKIEKDINEKNIISFEDWTRTNINRVIF